MSSRESRTPDHVHGLAGDIWAVGLLTLQLLSGDQDLLSSNKLKNESAIDAFLREALANMNPEPVSRNGLKFLRCCLELDPGKRLTAQQAKEHPWLTEPANEGELLKKR